jgi:rsbT antagonist protein RsbS
VSEAQDVTRIPLQRARDCVVASLQVDLDESILARFQADLLEFLARGAASGVLLDMSGVDVLDADEFRGLKRIMNMVAVMGSRPILAGLKPGVVSALVSMGLSGDRLETALNLDDAFARLEGDPESPR